MEVIMSQTENEIIEILSEMKPGIDFQTQVKLIDDKILTSFDIITLIAELDDRFGISIGPRELLPENFNSVTAISKLVESLQ